TMWDLSRGRPSRKSSRTGSPTVTTHPPTTRTSLWICKLRRFLKKSRAAWFSKSPTQRRGPSGNLTLSSGASPLINLDLPTRTGGVVEAAGFFASLFLYFFASSPLYVGRGRPKTLKVGIRHEHRATPQNLPLFSRGHGADPMGRRPPLQGRRQNVCCRIARTSPCLALAESHPRKFRRIYRASRHHPRSLSGAR